MKIKSLGLKVSLLVTLTIVAIIVFIFYIVSVQSDILIKDLTEKESKASNVAFSRELQSLQKDALLRSSAIAHSVEVVNAVLEHDVAVLKDILDLLGGDMDLITICDAEGNVIIRSHSNEKGDNILNQKAIESTIKTGTGVGTIERLDGSGLATRGSSVVKGPDGDVIGVVVCGNDLSLSDYVERMKDSNNCEATIFDGDTRLSTTLIDDDGNRVIGTKASDEVIETVMNQRGDYPLQIVLFGKNYSAYYSPLIIDNEVIGMLFTGIDIDEALKDQRTMISTLMAAAIICGAMGIILIFIFNIFAVSRPLKKIGTFAEKIRSGDLGISSASENTIAVRSADEVGSLARVLEHAYDQLGGYIGEISERMQGLSNGDLQTESTYDFYGDFINIKNAINGIVHDLNKTMTNVIGSSQQVSSGSRQLADGSQALAQGATEQAASIEELSGSIAEIAARTKINADLANDAAKLSDTIRDSAEKGSRQMDEMISAVKEINDASQSIGKIIKTIDDIAFQTNILALNAAVEAARAGQHGKGFAVVAEEVRNLASKSAEAAKDTGNMIQNSMEKAELGSHIASNTAASLTKIASEINESTRLIAEIATASSEQSMAIAQVNTGIDQVAQVIHQNSATAEESAASSEEMSHQSSVLQELISKFKL